MWANAWVRENFSLHVALDPGVIPMATSWLGCTALRNNKIAAYIWE